MTTPTDSSDKPTRLDLRGMIERFKLPGIDSKVLLESARKDIEAVLQTNEKVFVTAEALARKQAELFTELMKELQSSLKDSMSNASGAEKLNQASAHATRAITNTLTSMQQMAEITAHSNQELIELIDKRFRDGLKELRSSLHPSRGSAAEPGQTR